ncbi:MAG: flagellin lysine-N-methylase [Lachnospiraceae bacterium]|nr:flagellin lysine-N-methylase [Lachnospiraceae bacterium]
MSEIKISIFDEFFCIADKCSYSCCRDWNKIGLLDDEMKIYLEEPYIAKGIDVTEKKFKFKEDNRCTFLNNSGLCKLVLKYGGDILCHTCSTYPRIIRMNHGVKEFTLGNGCPKVLDMLAKADVPLPFLLEGEGFTEEYLNSIDTVIRDIIIDILQCRDFPLWKRIYFIYSFVNALINKIEDEQLAVMGEYNSYDYIARLTKNYDTIEIDFETIIKKLHYFFNYVNNSEENKKRMPYIKYIDKYCNKEINFDMKKIELKLTELNEYMADYENMLENICVNIVFRGITSSKQEVILNTVIAMIMTLTMSLYTLFLIKYDEKIIEENDMYNIFSYYSRIIENNTINYKESLDRIMENGIFSKGDFFILCKGLDILS